MPEFTSDASSDEQLVLAARTGSEEAMVALYERYRPRIMGFVLRMAGDRDLAEDVFCETFAAFFRHLDRYDSRGQFGAYLLRIARNKLLNELEARRRFSSAARAGETPSIRQECPLDHSVQSAEPFPDESAETAEMNELAQAALSRLPEHLREIIVLRVYEGLSYDDIGEIVAISEATARSRMRYAMQALRASLTVTVSR